MKLYNNCCQRQKAIKIKFATDIKIYCKNNKFCPRQKSTEMRYK